MASNNRRDVSPPSYSQYELFASTPLLDENETFFSSIVGLQFEFESFDNPGK